MRLSLTNLSRLAVLWRSHPPMLVPQGLLYDYLHFSNFLAIMLSSMELKFPYEQGGHCLGRFEVCKGLGSSSSSLSLSFSSHIERDNSEFSFPSRHSYQRGFQLRF